jgi:hypothetical protein
MPLDGLGAADFAIDACGRSEKDPARAPSPSAKTAVTTPIRFKHFEPK